MTVAIQEYKLPQLKYGLKDLEPVISEEIMNLHYHKHHQAYVTNLNKAAQELAVAQQNNDLPKILSLQSAINFNGGGHINHSIFWTNLAPKNQGGGEFVNGDLANQINSQFGSFDKFKELFSAKTVAIQGSGWGWLALNKTLNRLEIVTRQNQDALVTLGADYVPLLGIDVWEHAYYLQYKNVRADYVKAIWEIINWKDVNERFNQAKNK